jgi:protein TonB
VHAAKAVPAAAKQAVAAAAAQVPAAARPTPFAPPARLTRPPYPTISQENGEEGTVVLKIMVSPDGKVTNVGVAKSSGFARLDRAARNAGKNGRFQPNGWTEYTACR